MQHGLRSLQYVGEHLGGGDVEVLGVLERVALDRLAQPVEPDWLQPVMGVAEAGTQFPGPVTGSPRS